MTVHLRPITDDEVEAFMIALNRGFGNDFDPIGEPRFRRIMPLDRTLAAFDGDMIVGTLGEFDLHVTVPGGDSIAMSGTTMVTVRQTHRRQGILREMMTEHLTRSARRGDTLAGLWASEAPIYGRFGFGLATELHQLELDSRRVTVSEPAADVSVEFIEGDDALEVIPAAWTRIAASRPGFIDRGRERWQNIIEDPEAGRGGASANRHLVARRDGVIGAYARFRQREQWTSRVADGSILIDDLVADDGDAERALWHFLSNVDLFPHVKYWNAPVDSQLALDVSDTRELRRLLGDSVYVRILDIQQALRQRRYEADGTVVMRVADPMGFATGIFELEVSGGDGSVSRSNREPELAVDIRELGSLYLGRGGAANAFRAGRITGSAEAVSRLDRMMRTTAAPWCPEMF